MRSSLFAATALALVLAFAAPARAGEIGQIGSNTGISAETGNQDDASLQDLHRPADQAQPKKKKLKSGLGQNNTQGIIIIDGKHTLTFIGHTFFAQIQKIEPKSAWRGSILRYFKPR